MHPDWLSNAYLLAVEGGPAVFVDSGADVASLVEAAARWRATPVALLRTHAHGDHVEHEDVLVQRYAIPVVAEPGDWEWNGLRVRALATQMTYDVPAQDLSVSLRRMPAIPKSRFVIENIRARNATRAGIA